MLCKVINSNKNDLEKDINDWLKSGKYEIKIINQTESSLNGYITVTIFYYNLAESRQKKLETISKKNN